MKRSYHQKIDLHELRIEEKKVILFVNEITFSQKICQKKPSRITRALWRE